MSAAIVLDMPFTTLGGPRSCDGRLIRMKELAPGIRFASWRLDRVVGRGGMGVVYAATDLRLRRPVAIKVIADERAADPGFRERFEREARLAASVDHPNVVPVYAAGEEEGHLYIAMRFVAGTDLDRLLRRDGPVPYRRAAEIVRQVAEALDAAHAAGLVHRDVKPANVLLSGDHVYLGDFGLTRAIDADARLTDTDDRLGTVDFMSPEQLRGRRTDARSDVYALGCLLYALLVGTPPFHRATAAATVSAHLEAALPHLPTGLGVPSEFDAVLARALAKDPAGRYPSAGDLGRAAVAAARGETPTEELRSVARGDAAPEDRPTTRVPPRHEADPTALMAERRNFRPWRSLFGTIAAAVLLAGAVVAVLVLSTGGSDPNRPLGGTDVVGIARDFARAYADEDYAKLRSLLSADVERVSPGDTQRGRAAVLAQYRDQFRANRTRAYRLVGLTATGGAAGRAAARFTVVRTGRPPITGRVVLGVARIDGRPQIRLIATEPRS
jgi:hypothetical protein